MPTFIATLAYELDPSTGADARKLLRAELVGRRWQDRFEGKRMPANTLWIRRTADSAHTTDDVHAACAKDLHDAVAAVARTGRTITLVRAWAQVTGAGSWGLLPVTSEGPPEGASETERADR